MLSLRRLQDATDACNRLKSRYAGAEEVARELRENAEVNASLRAELKEVKADRDLWISEARVAQGASKMEKPKGRMWVVLGPGYTLCGPYLDEREANGAAERMRFISGADWRVFDMRNVWGGEG